MASDKLKWYLARKLSNLEKVHYFRKSRIFGSKTPCKSFCKFAQLGLSCYQLIKSMLKVLFKMNSKQRGKIWEIKSSRGAAGTRH